MQTPFLQRFRKKALFLGYIFVLLFLFRLGYGYWRNGRDSSISGGIDYFSSLNNLRKNYASEQLKENNLLPAKAGFASSRQKETNDSMAILSREDRRVAHIVDSLRQKATRENIAIENLHKALAILEQKKVDSLSKKASQLRKNLGRKQDQFDFTLIQLDWYTGVLNSLNERLDAAMARRKRKPQE